MIRAVATRSGRWWAVSFPDHPDVHTQARLLADVPVEAADVLSLWLEDDITPDDIATEVGFP